MGIPALPLSPDAAIKRKCRAAYRHHRDAASHDLTTLDYALSDLMELARASTQCFYCRMPLSFGFELDHRTPVARTVAAHRKMNLAVVCPECNRMKGMLDQEEFTRLLQLIRSFHPQAQSDIRRRLIAGGRRYRS